MFYVLCVSSELIAQNWQQQTSNTTDLLRCIVPIDQNNVWVSTTGGNILRTTNGGTNWVVQTKPKANYEAYSMYALNSSTAWVSLTNSSQLDWRISKTTNGGSTWTEQSINANSFGSLIHFKNLNDGIVIGDPATNNPTKWIIKKTTNGGGTYTDIPSNNIPDADESFGEYSPSNSGVVLGENLFFPTRGNSAQFIPKIYKSTNYGDSWISSPIYSFAGLGNRALYLAFKDSMNGIAVNTVGAVTKTTDGGNTWSEMEIVNTNGFYSAHYINNNTYVIGGGSSSQGVFYISVDGGNSWKKQNLPDGFPAVYSIKFANNSVGWIACHSGKIAKWIGGDITLNPGSVQVLFKINMKFQMRRNKFRPQNGDNLYIRGTFNQWSGADEMTDEDGDSIYTKLVTFDFNYRQEFKFMYRRGSTDVWEDGTNRGYIFNQSYTEFNGGFFNNDLFFEQLACAGAVPINNGQFLYTQSTEELANNVNRYSEITDYSTGSYTGGEKIYKLVVTDSCRIIASLLNKSNSNLHVFIKSECSPYAIGSYGESKAVFADGKPGIYYIIVDGWNGAQGIFNITVQCQPGKPNEGIVWFEDFEVIANERWFVTEQEWQIGELGFNPWRPAFGTKCAATNLTGNYSNARRTYLVKQEVFVVPPKLINPQLEFWHWYSFACDDYGQVRVRVARGNNIFSEWKNISQQYRNRNSSDVWTRTILDLSDYSDSTIQIAFYFQSDGCSFGTYEDAGWAIDNVLIKTSDYRFRNPENFDDGLLHSWSMEGCWEIGVPVYGSQGAYSVLNCAATKLTGNYFNGMRDYLISPYIMIPSSSLNPLLRFCHFYRFECGDFGQIKIRELGQTSWNDLPTARYEGLASAWTHPYHSLLGYAGKTVQIAFYFQSDGCSFGTHDDAGWYIDDIVIEPTQYIVVTSPKGKEVWSAGSVKEITWYSNQVNNVNISYSTNNGAAWQTVATDVPASPAKYQWTIPGTITNEALIKISDAGNSSISDVSDTTFTITPVIQWSSYLSVKENGNAQKSLNFGMSNNATSGLDPLFNEYELPPAPPTSVFDARFKLPGSPAVYSPSDFRDTLDQNIEWTINFQAGSAGYPVNFTWNISSLPEGTFYLQDNVSGGIVNINMKSQNSYSLTNSAITSLRIVYKKQRCNAILLSAGWNLASLPVLVSNNNASVVFPNTSTYIFGFSPQTGYTSENQIQNGKGYWLKYNTGNNLSFCGSAVGSLNIPVLAGWNLIGPYSDSVLVSGITGSGTSISSSFYGFNGGYYDVSVLKSGFGYWIKVSADGQLVLPPASVITKSNLIATKYNSNWGRLILTDRIGTSAGLYFSSDKLDISKYELPPIPPADIFDARFETQANVTTISPNPQIIFLNGGVYPIRMNTEKIAVLVQDQATEGKVFSKLIRPGETVELDNNGINSLLVSAAELPDKIVLEQNFPNPFNPATIIRFYLPEKLQAELIVYNTLGEKVTELVNEILEPGYHVYEFNAGDLTSGIYYYSLKTEDNTQVKKLLLMK